MNDISSGLPPSLMWDEKPELPKAHNNLGKDDFMKLLMTQLKHQDPLNPMDQQQFAAQLAQFSQLEQLTNIGTGIQSLKTNMGEGSKMQALGMIGKQVHATGSELELVGGQGARLTFAPKENVTPTKVSVFDGGGKLVREMDIVGPMVAEAQTGSVPWDGKDADGKPLPSGKYTFRVQGVGQDGQGQELGTELSGRVTGVEMAGATPMLVLETASGRQSLDLGKVRQVTDAPAAPAMAPQPAAGRAMQIPRQIAPTPLPVTREGEEEETAGVPEVEQPSMADLGPQLISQAALKRFQ